MITIIDYGMGNLGSIINMLGKIGVEAVSTSKIEDIEKARKIILPGVGSFDTAINNLNKLGLMTVLNKKVTEERIPTLGLCLGMQLLTEKSEEGKLPGLGWIRGRTIRFKFEDNLKIPHMGWNTINIKKRSPLLRGLDNGSRFYFVHSYHLVCDDEKDILATADYGYEFPTVVERKNVLGVQFHPEKSHKFGMKLLENFAKNY